jgi:formate hydrogenlyase subunit 3/multisubunit Na+/H+ antiporter MnhD subunit
VTFLYLAGAFLFGGSWAAKTGRSFHAVGLASLGAVAGSLMIRPFLFAAVFLEVAAMGAVLILAGSSEGARRGALRLLALYTMGMLATLLAGWQVEILGAAGGSVRQALQTTVLLGLGFSILMAIPPFHHWLPSSAESAHPYELALVVVLLQSAGLFFLLRFLDGYQWIRDNLQLFGAMRGAGAAMVVAGALLAAAQPRLSRALAYSLIAGLGVCLIAVGVRSAEGYQLAVGLVAAQAIGLAVCALGLASLLRLGGGDRLSGLRGAGRRSPLAAGAAFAGLLTLAGFPLTAGFPARWALLQGLAQEDAAAAAAVVLGSAALAAAALRWLGALLDGTPSDGASSLGLGERVFLAGGILSCAVLGVFPQVFSGIFAATHGLANLIP